LFPLSNFTERPRPAGGLRASMLPKKFGWGLVRQSKARPLAQPWLVVLPEMRSAWPCC